MKGVEYGGRRLLFTENEARILAQMSNGPVHATYFLEDDWRHLQRLGFLNSGDGGLLSLTAEGENLVRHIRLFGLMAHEAPRPDWS